MGYVDENLLPDERIEYRAHLHRIIFLPSAILAILAGVMVILAWMSENIPVVILVGIALLAASLILFTAAYVKWVSAEFAVTNRRVLIKVGIIARHTVELLLQKVEGVGVDQTLLGRVLGYGTLVVTGTGGTQEKFDKIADPLEFRRRVQHHSSPLPPGGNVVSAGGGPFCTKCGAGNPPESLYCSRCGTKLVTE